MATVSTAEFRPTDIYQYVPFTALQAGVTLGSSLTTGHIKVACFQEPVRVLEMTVVTAAGATTNASFRAAYGTITTAVTADLGTTLGAANSSLTQSANNSLAIDTATTYNSVDTGVSPVVPAGNVIGFNTVTGASNAITVVGVYLRYRPA